MELTDIKVTLYNDPALSALNWWWTLSVGGEVVGKGVATNDYSDAHDVAQWLATDLGGTYEEVIGDDYRAQQRSAYLDERIKRESDLGIVDPRSKRDRLAELMQDPRFDTERTRE